MPDQKLTNEKILADMLLRVGIDIHPKEAYSAIVQFINSVCEDKDSTITTLKEDIARITERFVSTGRPEEEFDLHDKGCPYKPFEKIPRWEEVPKGIECTCTDLNKARYWKIQHVIRLAEISDVKYKLAASEDKSKGLEEQLKEASRCRVCGDTDVVCAKGWAEEKKGMELRIGQLRAAIKDAPVNKFAKYTCCLENGLNAQNIMLTAFDEGMVKE